MAINVICKASDMNDSLSGIILQHTISNGVA